MVSILNFNLKDSNTLFNFENCSIYSFKLCSRRTIYFKTVSARCENLNKNTTHVSLLRELSYLANTMVGVKSVCVLFNTQNNRTWKYDGFAAKAHARVMRTICLIRQFGCELSALTPL
jgi:hypothetical protein